MKEEGRRRESLLRRIRCGYDCVMLNHVRMEITGGERVLIEGCQEILEYGRGRICLSVRDARVRSIAVVGSNLRCLSYHPDAVVIEGELESVCFCAEDGEVVS